MLGCSVEDITLHYDNYALDSFYIRLYQLLGLPRFCKMCVTNHLFCKQNLPLSFIPAGRSETAIQQQGWVSEHKYKNHLAIIEMILITLKACKLRVKGDNEWQQ